ncbi:MAG: AraC family transcriptional regulator [Clostridia bacterium]
MQVYLEERNASGELNGLMDCFLSDNPVPKEVSLAHTHEYCEILYCLKGAYELLVDQWQLTLETGDIVLVHPMTPHQTRSLCESGNQYIVLKFVPDALYSAERSLQVSLQLFWLLGRNQPALYRAEKLRTSGLGELMHRVLDERRRRAFGYEIALRCYAEQVMLWFIRAWHSQHAPCAENAQTFALLRSALQYMERHLAEPITLHELARCCHMGDSTFSRFFARTLGQSFPIYLGKVRLAKGAAKLAESGLSITEIALECGFSSASYFSQCFREQYLMTPTQYRQMYYG